MIAMLAVSNKTLDIAKEWVSHDYYDRAESKDWMKVFWHQGDFLKLFEKLDMRVAVELACGHGRHTAHVLDVPSLRRNLEQIHLIDVNEENIKYCRERFTNSTIVSTNTNNGYDFQPLRNDSISSIFCYDAMVHFEFDAVISYVMDAFRVLEPGGRALFHHSNCDRYPGADYSENPHGRNFMSKNLFAHIASRAGFEILDQVLIDWDRFHNLDCISLIEKPRKLDGASHQVPAQSKLKQFGRWRMVKRLKRRFGFY
jgi:SAM-dependent methyltransferase